MSEHWQQVLATSAQTGAPVNGIKVACENDAILEVCGDDALDFLHAQFCADLRQLQNGHGVLTAWCNPKGRVQYLVTVLRDTPSHLWLLVPQTMVEAFSKRLTMFVLRADVKIEDRSGEFAAVHTLGGVPRDPVPGTSEFSAQHQQWYIVPLDQLQQSWDLIEGAPAHGETATTPLIQFGIPYLDPLLVEKFLPQELDLDRMSGLSFDKGCYPGQEIIARVKFRGEVKRRPRRFTSTDIDLPAAGASLVDADGNKKGTVLLAAPNAEDEREILAVVDNVEAGTELFLDGESKPLTAQSLPD